MVIDFSSLRHNRFDVLCQIKDAIKPQTLERGNGYIRLSSKGDFELFDYGATMLSVKLYYTAHSNSRIPLTYEVLMHVGCLDDGDWVAYSHPMDTIEDCKQLIENIRSDFYDDLSVLPTAEKLNELLQKHGMYGSF